MLFYKKKFSFSQNLNVHKISPYLLKCEWFTKCKTFNVIIVFKMFVFGVVPGFEILKQMLSEERVVPHLPLGKIWEWLVGVACRQTGHQRLKAIHLLLRIVRCCSHSDLCDLGLLKPLWQLFTHMEYGLFEDVTQPGILLPLHRALTELFFVTENRAQELGLLQEYLLALTTEDHLLRCAAQALQNIAAISLAINYPNKATRLWNVEC